MAALAVLVFLVPLLASVVQLLVGKRVKEGGDWFTVLAMLVAWGGAATIAGTTLLGIAQPGFRETAAFTWLSAGGRAWRLGFMVDNVSAATLFTVVTCSLLIHVYSTGYMRGDPRYARFFAYISFFTAAMIGLVLSDNLVTFFVCWELMGLCSYLLIGFWYEKPEAYRAAIKAFLTTRVGDALFLLGIAVVFAGTGEVTFEGIYAAVEAGAMGETALLLASACFLAGCVGKSAQFPLHVWLPDAMEGPTPVSALIHAATMVAAGIYLVARTIPIFPPEIEAAAALLGSFTAVFAASMALVHFDFKKVLAYSTISQLGYMLMGLGVGASAAGLFHLTTHAFFKALLFLASGAVLHATHSRDMREMGGLKDRMPWTFGTTVIGTLALCGVPPLSGFYSKDAILGAALGWGMDGGGWRYVPWVLGLVGAGMTAFYMTRAVALVFVGAARTDRAAHAHEAPLSMTGPLVVLALFAVSAGWVHEGYARLVAPHEHVPHAAHAIAMGTSLAAAAAGFGLAAAMYVTGRVPRDVLTRTAPGAFAHKVLSHLYWVDEVYAAFLVRPCLAVARALGRFDRTVVDQFAVDGVGRTVRGLGGVVRRAQTGRVQDYGIGLAGGLAALCAFILYLTGR